MLELKERGVYKITCNVNNKLYVGSTWQSFIKRFCQHEYELVKNKHKNSYLQSSWNKYGQESFSFEILEIVTDKESLYIREQYWMDLLDSVNKENGYNINPYATGGNQFSDEIVAKRAATMKIFLQECNVYYTSIKNGEVLLENIPEKYIKYVNHLLTRTVWNKGLTKENTDYSYLKGVPKKNSEKRMLSRKLINQHLRETRTPYIDIYFNNVFIRTFRSAKDIEEYSLTEDNNLPMVLVNKTGRNGYPPNVLKSQNILNCCKGVTKLYKGLSFRFKQNT